MVDSPVVCARDVMEREVITVAPDTPLLDVHRLFVEDEIHGAPVVGDDGIVHGVVSTLDLVRIVRGELEPGTGATAMTYFRGELPYAGPDWLRMPEDLPRRMQALTAADAMTRELVMLGPDATIHEVTRAMLTHKVHRALIGEDRVLQGVITSFDLLRVLSLATAPATGATRYTGYHRGDVR